MPSPASDPTRFQLDRDALAEYIGDDVENGGYDGIEAPNLADAVAHLLEIATDAGAISSPFGLDVIAYSVRDGELLVAIREHHNSETATSERQLVTLAFAPPEAFDEPGFENGCAVIENLLRRANRLVMTYEILDYAERQVAAIGGGPR